MRAQFIVSVSLLIIVTLVCSSVVAYFNTAMTVKQFVEDQMKQVATIVAHPQLDFVLDFNVQIYDFEYDYQCRPYNTRCYG